MGDWDTYFGGDPAPGDAVMVRIFGKDLSKTSREAKVACSELEGLQRRWRDAVWEGPAADRFRDFISSLPTDLAKLQASYALAGSALQTYADELRSAQRDAQQALGEAKAADKDQQAGGEALAAAEKRRMAALKSRNSYDSQLRSISHKLTLPYPPGDPTPHNLQVQAKGLRDGRKVAQRDLETANTDKTTAQRTVDDAGARLTGAKRLADQASRLRVDAARRAQQKIEAASDAGIQNKSAVQKSIDWGFKVYRNPLSALDDLERSLKAIGSVLATIGAVLYVIALLVPGLNVIVAAISLVVLAISVLALACTVVLWANGRRSGWDVIWGSVDVGLGLVGAKADIGVLSKGAGALSKGARSGGALGGLQRVNKELGSKGGRSALAEILSAKGSKYKALRNYVLRNSETAGAIKRICWWRDARYATGALHFAHATERGPKTFVVLVRGGFTVVHDVHSAVEMRDRLRNKLRTFRDDWTHHGPRDATCQFVKSYADPKTFKSAVKVARSAKSVNAGGAVENGMKAVSGGSSGTFVTIPGHPPVRADRAY